MKQIYAIITLVFVLLLSACGATDSTVAVSGAADLNVNDNTAECQATVRNGTLYLRSHDRFGTRDWAIYDTSADYSVLGSVWVKYDLFDAARTYVETPEQLAIIDE